MSAHYQIAGRTAAAISASVESGVRTGRLSPGAALPAVRALAGELGVSPATVAAAYRTLRQRGLVDTAGRNGTRVRPRPPVAALVDPAARRADLMPPPVPGAVDLSAGAPDPRLLPDPGPRLRAIAGQVAAVGYHAGGPLPELMTLARERLAADGVRGAVTVTGGALDGIERVLGAYLRPGDRLAVEDPGWANLLDLAAAMDLRPVPVPVDDDGPTEAGLRAALAAGAVAAVVTTRAQNPTGAAVSRTRAAALRRVLRTRPQTLVVEDDHAAELATVPLHALAGATGRWAFVRSVSKPYGPDLRLAVLAGDDTTVARVEGRMRLGTGWVSTVLQRLVVAMWTDLVVSATVARAREEYAARRDGLCAALRARGLAAHGRTGINVWVPVADETAALARLRDDGYAVAPGVLYRVASPPALRLTVSGLDRSGVDALADAVARAVRPPAAGRTA